MSTGRNNLKRSINLIHQVDRLDGKVTMDIYILDVPLHFGRKLEMHLSGWTWVPGPDGGFWTTKPDNDLVKTLIEQGMQVVETGGGA